MLFLNIFRDNPGLPNVTEQDDDNNIIIQYHDHIPLKNSHSYWNSAKICNNYSFLKIIKFSTTITCRKVKFYMIFLLKFS